MTASLRSRLRCLCAAAGAALVLGAGPVVAETPSDAMPTVQEMMDMMGYELQAHSDMMLGLSAASAAMEMAMPSDGDAPMTDLTASVMEIMARALAQMESMMSMLHDMHAMMPPAGDVTSPEMTAEMEMAMHSDEVMMMFMDTVAELRSLSEMWLSMMAAQGGAGS